MPPPGADPAGGPTTTQRTREVAARFSPRWMTPTRCSAPGCQPSPRHRWPPPAERRAPRARSGAARHVARRPGRQPGPRSSTRWERRPARVGGVPEELAGQGIHGRTGTQQPLQPGVERAAHPIHARRRFDAPDDAGQYRCRRPAAAFPVAVRSAFRQAHWKGSGLSGPETNLAAAGQQVFGRGPVRAELDHAIIEPFSEPGRREQGDAGAV